MIDSILDMPIFGITLTLAAYVLALALAKRIRSPLANPIYVAALFCIIMLKLTGIPIARYQVGGKLLMMLILPATISLAVMVYENITHLKRHLIPILVGSTVGAATSLGSVLLLGKMFGLEDLLIQSLLPKSVTAAIALDLAPVVDGDVALTIMAVMLSGMTGVIIGPLLLRMFRIKDPILQGIAMGTSSHVLGTSRAMEMGSLQGAISSISLFITGMATVAIVLIVL